MSRRASPLNMIFERYGRRSRLNHGFRLFFLFGVAVIVVLLMVGNIAPVDAWFQSPQSPPAQPEPTATPVPPEPTPVPPPTNTPVPTEPPPPTETPPEPVAEEEIQEAEPTEEVVAPEPPPETPTPPPAEPVEEQAVLEAEVQTEPQPEAAAPTGLRPEPLVLNEAAPVPADNAGSPNFILDRAELIDTFAISGAYIWLCCGIGFLLLTPLTLLMLYVRGRSRILDEEL